MRLQKEYDFVYVSTVTGDLNFCYALHEACARQSYSFVVATANFRDYKSLINSGVHSVYVRGRRTTKSARVPFDVAKEVDRFVRCENAYYGLPYFFLRRIYPQLASGFLESFRGVRVGAVLQNPGGELIRKAASDWAKIVAVPEYIFGEKFGSGSVVYGDHWKKLVLPASDLMVSAGDPRAVSDKAAGIVEYKRPSVSGRRKRLSKIAEYLLWFDLYPVSSAVGYRLKRSADLARGFVIDFLSDSRVPEPGFVLLTFNVQAESELFVRNIAFVNPLRVFETARAIASSTGLPLYVKGHPGKTRSFGVLATILMRLRGGRIIRSSLPATSLLSGASVVAFVSSTVGVEAIQRGRPICVLGKWPYSPLAESMSTAVLEGKARLVDAGAFYGSLDRFLWPGSSLGTLEDLERLLSALRSDFLEKRERR